MSEEEYFQLLPEVVKRRDHPLSIPHEVAFTICHGKQKARDGCFMW